MCQEDSFDAYATTAGDLGGAVRMVVPGRAAAGAGRGFPSLAHCMPSVVSEIAVRRSPTYCTSLVSGPVIDSGRSGANAASDPEDFMISITCVSTRPPLEVHD